MKYLFFLLIPFFALIAEPLPFNLTHPLVTKASEIEEEEYDKLSLYVKGTGYVSHYGHTWEQELEFPKTKDSKNQEKIISFITKSINIPRETINAKGFGTFTKDSKEYWIKTSVSSSYYSYILLRVEAVPDRVVLDFDKKYEVDKKYFKRYGETNIPHNIALPHIKGYAISRTTFSEYDEQSFYYTKKATMHKGKFWKIDFSKTDNNPNSGRYSTAHDYKAKMLLLGAEVLKDEDNRIFFKLQHNNAINIVEFSSYDSSFSLKIIQEESFKQTLILAPDAIKTELDKTGKITLDGIYFDFNKATLKPESNKAILSTVALMQRYTDLVLSIHGHTDNKGDEAYNAKLSTQRAKSVMQAIVSHGIDSSRLTFKGHGEAEPIATNDTDEGRAQNRRVELHKESGGDKKSIITIDFIKPLENSVQKETYTHQNSDLNIQYTKPYSDKKELKNYKGTEKSISYEIMKGDKLDKGFSRKAIVKNYLNILELYNAKIVGEYSNTIYFIIEDRGDSKTVYGRLEAYTGSYTIRFLIQE